MAILLGKTPHNPRTIPVSNMPSQNMNDIVAILSDPFFFISDAQHELSKRQLEVSGRKDDLLRRLFEALKAEHADGWTLGYLLSTKIQPFNGNGRDPRSLIGHHVKSYNCDEDGIMILELSDGEDAVIPSHNSCDGCARIKMDHDLFWAFHTLDGMNAVSRHLAQKPLLILEAAVGVHKNRWGKEAGSVLGLKLEGMSVISFFFLAAVLQGEASIREDRICGDVWLAENDVLCEDVGVLGGGDEMVLGGGDEMVLHGGDETAIEGMTERPVTEDESAGYETDMRGGHGKQAKYQSARTESVEMCGWWRTAMSWAKISKLCMQVVRWWLRE